VAGAINCCFFQIESDLKAQYKGEAENLKRLKGKIKKRHLYYCLGG
jgi:hypothetical protein